jgi:hypothetical protein
VTELFCAHAPDDNPTISAAANDVQISFIAPPCSNRLRTCLDFLRNAQTGRLLQPTTSYRAIVSHADEARARRPVASQNLIRLDSLVIPNGGR